MARVKVYRINEDGTKTPAGSFDPDMTFERFGDCCEWDPRTQEWVHAVPGRPADEHGILYRTRNGRWIMGVWKDGEAPSYHYADEAEVREWLWHTGRAEAIVEYLDRPADEPEKRRPGRPQTGTAIHTRIPDDMVDRIDQLAADEGVTRAEMIRRLLAQALAN